MQNESVTYRNGLAVVKYFIRFEPLLAESEGFEPTLKYAVFSMLSGS